MVLYLIVNLKRKMSDYLEVNLILVLVQVLIVFKTLRSLGTLSYTVLENV